MLCPTCPTWVTGPRRKHDNQVSNVSTCPHALPSSRYAISHQPSTRSASSIFHLPSCYRETHSHTACVHVSMCPRCHLLPHFPGKDSFANFCPSFLRLIYFYTRTSTRPSGVSGWAFIFTSHGRIKWLELCSLFYTLPVHLTICFSFHSFTSLFLYSLTDSKGDPFLPPWHHFRWAKIYLNPFQQMPWPTSATSLGYNWGVTWSSHCQSIGSYRPLRLTSWTCHIICSLISRRMSSPFDRKNRPVTLEANTSRVRLIILYWTTELQLATCILILMF